MKKQPQAPRRPEKGPRAASPSSAGKAHSPSRPASASKPGPHKGPPSAKGAPAPKARRSHVDSAAGFYLTSWAGLSEYLQARPDLIKRIVVSPNDHKKLESLLNRYKQKLPVEVDADEKGIAVYVRLETLDETQFLEELDEGARSFILACDHVTDTRNLGAIARSAAYFGVRYLLLPKDRQAPITGATLGTAQGAFAYIKPVEVTNLGRTLNILKERGYWVLAADMDGEPVESLRADYEKKVLVLGSEDKGVSSGILSKADLTVAISTPNSKLESLNVSVAAGILIHALNNVSSSSKKKI